MKLIITPSDWSEFTPNHQQFIQIWKQKKGYQTPMLRLDECIELLMAISYNLHTDDSDGRFFNNILTNAESVIGWDGMELIDILCYEIKQNLNKRLANAKVFSAILIPKEVNI